MDELINWNSSITPTTGLVGTTTSYQWPPQYQPALPAPESKLERLLRVAKEFSQLDTTEQEAVMDIALTLDAALNKATVSAPSTQRSTQSCSCNPLSELYSD